MSTFTPTDAELAIYQHWQEKSATHPRSDAVKESHLRRIRARLRDGYAVEELKRAVDVACWDRFYVEHGFHKQADVVFRNATRIDTLLFKWEREASRPVPL
jgi:hypothetical protein